MKQILFLATFIFTLYSCSDTSSLTGKISVSKIVNPDEIPPTVTFITTPSAITGNNDFTLDYQLNDNTGISGIKNATLSYSADGITFKTIKSISPSSTSLKLCIPNKNLPQLTFKITATDKNGNTTEELLGNELGNYFTVNLDSEPNLPGSVTSSQGLLTNQANTKLYIDVCVPTKCSSDAVILDASTNNLFVAQASSQPASGDSSWVSCSDAVANGITTPNFLTETNYTYKIWTKSEDTNFDSSAITHISTSSKDITVTYDVTPPDNTGIIVEGTTLTGKSQGTYRLTSCSDITKVLINKAGVPSASDSAWQNCSTSAFSIKYTDFVSGTNNLKFWVKDAAENVNTSFIAFTTTYDPPSITVVDGPTISTSNARLTVEFCDEAGITHLFFNETGSAPTASASGWQTCSTASGHFGYGPLSPGSTTLKAFFKYNDGLISPNPIDVPVYYSPTVTWVQSPLTRRPQSTFTLASCEGVSSVFVKAPGPAPLATDAGWQTCATTAAAISYDGLSVGTQTLNFWFKDALDNVYGEYATSSVTFTPPQTTVKNAPTISTPRAFLTADTCTDISQVLVTMDDASTPTGVEGGWVSCSTASNALQSPLFGTDGSHTIRVWYKFSDNYILTVNNEHIVTYVSPDTTPPPITIGEGATTPVTVTLENGDASTPPLLLANDSRADFTLNTCTPTADSLDEITHVIITESASAPSFNATDWVSCTTTSSAIQSKSLSDGTHTLYFWFKDAYENVSTSSISLQVQVDTSSDAIDPPRPLVTVEGAPVITTAPATMTVSTCTDIDQVFVNNNADPAPSSSASEWQNCSTATGAITYAIDVAGDYTLQVWFKDTAGNINPVPRNVSFIFEPVPSTLPEPLAYWSLDNTHFFQKKALDTKSGYHLSVGRPTSISKITGKINEALDFDGSQYLITEANSNLQPTVAVSFAMWANLTNGDGSTKHLGGNISSGGGYGFRQESNELKFIANNYTVKVATSSYTTGWHYLTGTTDGQILKLYIDGSEVDSYDSGSPSNISYGCAKAFAIGASVATCTTNVDPSNKFIGGLDEISLWNVALSSTQAYNLYVDQQNKFKPNYSTTKPANIASASFSGTFEQAALLTVPSCGDGKFIYLDETTHPPTISSSKWIPCNTMINAYSEGGLGQGAHELKVWTKDEYENISAGYIKVNTSITSLTTTIKPIVHFNLDNSHNSSGKALDYFSHLSAKNNGATVGQSAIQGEGYKFTKSEGDYIESLYASSAMVSRDFTFSVWAKLTKNDNRDQVIAGNRVGSSGYSIEIDGANAELKFIIESTSGRRELAVTTTSFESDFHNIVGSYNGQVAKMYIDGVQVATSDFGSMADINYTCLNSFVIGAGATCNQGAAAGTHFDNIIDEVIVWNTSLSGSDVDNLFNGQDTVPPEPVDVTPRNNEYTVGIPLVRVNIENCDDIATVYVTTSTTPPDAAAAGWQTCSTTGDKIYSDLLTTGVNTVKTWFKDAAGNVSLTSTDMSITFNYDFTIPNPDSYWTLDNVNIEGATAYDVTAAKHGLITTATEVAGVAFEGLKLNGTDSNILVNYDSHFQPTSTVSLSAWVRVTTWPSSEKYIAGNLNDGGYAILLGNNTIEFKVKANGTINTISYPTGSFVPNTYYMITGVYDQGNMRLFVNNTEVTNNNIGLFDIDYTYSNAFVIGAQAGTANNVAGSYLFGNIDEVSFFRQAITDTVVSEMYDRGIAGDKIFYDVTPPEVPTTLNLIYYNSLVSRANLTATDCTGIDYIIVTASKFPPDKNDEDWQLCNTLTGGILSKELDPSDSYGKVWTKNTFGNISKTFQYTPITTNYDKPIARPVVHWTFDTAHNNSTTRELKDRISGAILKSEKGNYIDIDPDPGVTTMNLVYDGTADNLYYDQSGVLNKSVRLQGSGFTRCDNCDHLRITEKLSVATWVYIPNAISSATKVILGNTYGTTGYSIRLKNSAPIGARVEFSVSLENGQTLTPYLETSNFATGWHLVTGVYDGQTASLYFDGIFVKSFTASAASAIKYQNNVKFAVGNGPSLATLPTDFPTTTNTIPSTYTDGSIDEVLIWDQALSGLMVSSLYHNGADILYNTDTTAPVNPTLTQENQNSAMYDNRLYITVNSCSDISGVLVNEGTLPDKQDDRWEICRTRPGSFSRGLTEGGHTVTLWFKDLAGNITPVSSDLVVDYTSLTMPIPNAYWPLDEASYVDRKARDVVSSQNIHNMFAYNFESRENATSGFETGKVNEAMNLGGRSYLTGDPSKLTRVVNELTLAGWFYLDTTNNSQRTLIESAYNNNPVASPDGYRLYLANASTLRLQLGLTISGNQDIGATITGYTTGWHHVAGVFDNNKITIYFDGAQVQTTTLTENDFIKWSYTPRINIGADVEASTTRPGTMFSEKVDEVAIWGMALDSSAITDIYNKGNAGQYIVDIRREAKNVNNAYISFVENFESRAKFTMLDCKDIEYVYIGDPTVSSPDPKSKDWRQCRTTPGAIISAKLPTGTQYVRVWAKNLYGDISPGFAIHEIDPIDDDDDIPLPVIYQAFNNGQSSTNYYLDTILGADAYISSGVSNIPQVTNATGRGIASTASYYLTLNRRQYNDQALGQTIIFNSEITQSETGARGLYQQGGTKIYINSSRLVFQVTRPLATSYYNYTTTAPSVSIPTSIISTGVHQIATQYDGKNLKLYLDGVLRASLDASEDNFQTTGRLVLNEGPSDITFGQTDATYNTGKFLDELMIFDELLTETEIISFYDRLKVTQYPGDTTAPTTIPTVAIDLGTWNGSKWQTQYTETFLTLNDCTDIAAVYVTVNDATVPLEDISGWQYCSTSNGAISIPTLSSGDNTIRIWFKDAAGNVTSSSIDTTVEYTDPGLYAPVAYWSFDSDSIISEKAYESANLNHAELNYYKSVAGKSGQALHIDNVRSHAMARSNNAFKPTEELSISLWLNMLADCKGDNGAILSTYGGSDDGWKIYFENNYTSTASCLDDYKFLNFNFSRAGVAAKSTMPKSFLTAGIFNHLVITYDGRRVRWYVNDVLRHTDDFLTEALITYNAISQTPLYFGTDVNTTTKGPNTDFLNGYIDEVAIFNKAISQSMIDALYAAGNGGTKVYNPTRSLAAPTIAKASIFESGTTFFYGDRIRVTMNSCTDSDIILINNSTTTPSVTDPDWQLCNLGAGGILSAALGTGTVTPKIWVKSIDGTINATYSTLNNETITIPDTVSIPRPKVFITLDETSSNHTTATNFFDMLNFNDQSKNGTIPLTYEPTPTSTGDNTDSIIHESFIFDGIDDYLYFEPTAINTFEDKISLSVWAYLVKGDSNDSTIISNIQNITADQGGAAIRIKDNTLEFVVSPNQNNALAYTASSTYKVGISNYNYNTGFHHIVGTFDGGELKLYLDGVFIDSYALSFYAASQYYMYSNYLTPWYIGADPDETGPTAGTYFNGTIDDINMWSEVLTEPEIIALYNYGAQYKITNLADGKAPVDPGITIKENLTTLTSPFAYFTMPTCEDTSNSQGVASIPINSIYIKVNDNTPPTNFEEGWQYCSKEADSILSSLLDSGNSTIYIYFRDEEGDISSATTMLVNYIPPEMINPRAYYKFESNLDDSAGKLFLMNTYPPRYVTGKVGTAFGLYSNGSSTNTKINYSYVDELKLVKNFAISFWFMPTSASGVIFQIPNQVTISKDADEKISAIVTSGWWGNYTSKTEKKVTPNAWNHIGVKRENNVVKIFLNGRLSTSFSIPDQDLRIQSDNYVIGGDTGSQTTGYFDEVAIYNKNLSDDQIQYAYYLGYKGQSLPTFPDNFLAPSIPNHYYSFDDADLVVTTLADKGKNGTVNLTPVNAVIQGNATAMLGQSFYQTRYENTLEAEDTSSGIKNTVGPKQSTVGGSSVTLGTDFTISTWVKSTKTTYAKDEKHTIISQWGENTTDESFVMWIDRHTDNNGKIYFGYRTTTGGYLQVAAGLDTIPTTNTNWNNIVVRKQDTKLTMYVNGHQSGYNNNVPDAYAVRTPTVNLRFGDIEKSTAAGDEWNFQGYYDEVSIWTNTAISQTQIYDLYTRGATKAVTLNPELALSTPGATTEDTNATLSINDCHNVDYVWVAYATDTAPNAGDSGAGNQLGWQSCSTVAGSFSTPDLIDGLNSMVIYFKSGGVVSSYTYSLDITKTSTDLTPPALPNVTLTSGTPTTSPIATFTVDSCLDIAGIYINTQGSSAPSKSASDWISCSTIASAIKYPKLADGANNISMWFKDASGNVTTSTRDFAITYNAPALTDPSIYIPFNKTLAGSGGVYDIINDSIYKGVNTSKIYLLEDAFSNEAMNFLSTGYFERVSGSVALTDKLSFSAWINLTKPSVRSSIYNSWNDTATNNSYSVDVDTDGRLCLAFQTVNSLGNSSWNTDKYARICSNRKINFGSWNHISLTRNATSLIFYINGASEAADAIDSGNFKTNAIKERIGAQARGSNNNYTVGIIDELALWDIELSAAQIEDIYSKGLRRAKLKEQMQPQAASIPSFYWSFDTVDYNSGTYVLADRMLNMDLTNTLSTSLTYAVDGVTGTTAEAFEFNNVEYLVGTDNINFNTNFTISTWIYLEDDSDDGFILNKWASSQEEFKLYTSAGIVKFDMKTSDAVTTSIASPTAISYNKWTNIVIVRTGTVLEMYINGALDVYNNAVVAAGIGTKTSTLKVGWDGSGTDNFFQGLIDDTVIYHSSLNKYQVANLYTNGKSNIAAPSSVRLSAAHPSNTVTGTNVNLTISDCASFTDAIILPVGSAQPLDTDGGWVTCSTAIGANTYSTLSLGTNNLEVWFKTGSTVESSAATTISIISE